MTLPHTELVMETIDCLMAVSGSTVPPIDAANRLRRIEARHPRTQLRLLWQDMGADEHFHYDALLRLPQGGGTLSLGFCRELSVPWLMQGARRWNDGDLLRVGDSVLTVDQAIAHLDCLSEDSPMAPRLVDACLVHAELGRHPVEVSDAELQRAMDGLRRAHRLYTSADTHRWMERRGIEHADLERLAADHAALAGLRSRITAGRVSEHFAQHHADFDTACIAQIACPTRGAAQQTYSDIQAGRVDFFQAAQHRFRQAAERGNAIQANLFQTLRRGREPSALSSQVFDAAAGDLLSPIDCDDGCLVVRVLSLAEAGLDDATHDLIQRLLFDQWLEQQRASADIEWCRGRAKSRS